MRIPKVIQHTIDAFERLPGIGPKSAQRLTFYLLHVPQSELDKLALSVQNLKKETQICSVCFTVDETNPCSICVDPQRDGSVICVVEQPLDVLALEKSGKYKGVYHVLHGRIDPLSNIGPNEIYIPQLLQRLQKGTSYLGTRITEVILSTNPTMEGEATAMFLAKQIKVKNEKLKITRIGRGLPIGADIEYADSTTLERAMEGRSEY